MTESLNTLYIDFIKSACSTRDVPAKIILADMPVGEYINSLVVKQPLSRLKETVRLCNFVTLMEKCNFAHNTLFRTGCIKCEPKLFDSEQNRYVKKTPEAYLEVLGGDKDFLPIEDKVKFFADKVYQSLLENKQYKKVLVGCGSFQLYDIIRMIMENDDKECDFDDYDFQKHKDELRREFGKNSKDYLEKIALLEVLHEVIDNGSVRELSVKGKHRIDIDRYISLIDHYTDLLSFESISPNIKFSTNHEGKNVKNCLADELIFGLGEDKEYIEDQNSSESIFSIMDEQSEIRGTKKRSSSDSNNEEEVIIEDEAKPEEVAKETNRLFEEIKRHEEKSKPHHYIDQIYNVDELKLLKSIVDVINFKTLFIDAQGEEQKTLINDQSEGKSDSQSTPNKQSSPDKSKIKFKKSVPRFSKNSDNYSSL